MTQFHFLPKAQDSCWHYLHAKDFLRFFSMLVNDECLKKRASVCYRIRLYSTTTHANK